MKLVTATPEMVSNLAGPLRRADIEEWCTAVNWNYPAEVLLRFCISRDAATSRAVLDERGKALCFWGVGPGEKPEVGIAWMVATKEALRRVHSLHRHFKQGIAEMHEAYPTLEAYAYIKNTVHHRWMERVGFACVGQGKTPGTEYYFLKFVRHKEP